MYEMLPRERDLGDDKLPSPEFQDEISGTWVSGAQIPGGYDIPVMGTIDWQAGK